MLLVPLCLVYFWFPGDADQTLFELGAARLAQGAVYYRDVWDIKQPGIYWVYQLGARLGVGVVGPRLLEVVGALLGAVVVWRLTARWAPHPLSRALAPTLVMGSYLLFTQHGGVVVVEGLTIPLLVGIVALVWPAAPGGGPPRPAWRWAVAGVATGLVGVLKVLYLPLPAVLLVGAVLLTRAPVRTRVRRLAVATAGALLPLTAMAAYFAANGAWRVFWVTTFDVPRWTRKQPVLSASRAQYLEIALALGTLLLPLAVVALATAARRGTRGRDATLAATALVAVVLAWVQFPTPYRMLILVAPLGLLAVVGLEVLASREPIRVAGRRWPAVLLVVIAIASLPSWRGPQRLVFAADRIPSWGLGMADRNARDEVLIHEYASQDVAPVRALVRPGDSVYVVGHPQPYQLLGVREAVEISGWGSALQPPQVWRERDRELVRSRPRWVFVETEMSGRVQRLAPRFAAVLARDYGRVATTPRGTWYRTDRPGTPSGIPGDNRLG